MNCLMLYGVMPPFLLGPPKPLSSLNMFCELKSYELLRVELIYASLNR